MKRSYNEFYVADKFINGMFNPEKPARFIKTLLSERIFNLFSPVY